MHSPFLTIVLHAISRQYTILLILLHIWQQHGGLRLIWYIGPLTIESHLTNKCSVNHFCVDLDVCFGSNNDPVLDSWQGHPDSDLKCPGITWSSWWHVPQEGFQGLWRKNSPTTSRNLHLHHTGYFRYRPNQPWLLVAEKLHFCYIWP